MLESLKIRAKEPLALPLSASLALLATASALPGAGVEALPGGKKPATAYPCGIAGLAIFAATHWRRANPALERAGACATIRNVKGCDDALVVSLRNKPQFSRARNAR